ncbi:MAG: sigma-70 family RNA polymerase sigma factor [Bacteroidota bacterium]
MGSKEQRLQERLRKDDKQALKEVYLTYKGDFWAFFTSRNVPEVDLEDIYHEAVVAMYQNFVLKQLKLEKASLKSYLIAIGKNKVLTKYKEERRITLMESVAEVSEEVEEIDFDLGPDNQRRQLANAYQQMGDKCRELLKLFYYRGFSIREIVVETGYKDENTVKSYKSRCLKKLKKTIRMYHG